MVYCHCLQFEVEAFVAFFDFAVIWRHVEYAWWCCGQGMPHE